MIRRDELVVDSFAGGGGASTGIEAALGRPIDIAINHDPKALAIHKANHPRTKHYCESIFDLDPKQICGGRPVGLAWFSPDCTHYSKARGGKPVKKDIRGLAWAVVRWAAAVRPRVIALENVEEFLTWGPLVAKRGGNGKALRDDNGELVLVPCKKRQGRTFRQWKGRLEALGYQVEWRVLHAHHYGAPTSRKRLFIVARCDGEPIRWPEPTHGEPLEGLKPYRTAAEIIDWSIPCPSIFERKRPLAENTLKRIATGIRRFVIEHPDPFIIANTSANPPSRCDEPLKTITTGNHHYLVAAFLAKHFGGVTGQDFRKPFPTATARGTQQQIVTSHLLKLKGTCRHGRDVREPMPTVQAGGLHVGEVRAFLMKYYSNGENVQDARQSVPTISTHDRLGIVTVHGVAYQIVDIGMRMLIPRELFRAQSFPDDYVIDPLFNGKPLPKTAQVHCCGNSVPPVVASAIVTANFGKSAPTAAAMEAA